MWTGGTYPRRYHAAYPTKQSSLQVLIPEVHRLNMAGRTVCTSLEGKWVVWIRSSILAVAIKVLYIVNERRGTYSGISGFLGYNHTKSLEQIVCNVVDQKEEKCSLVHIIAAPSTEDHKVRTLTEVVRSGTEQFRPSLARRTDQLISHDGIIPVTMFTCRLSAYLWRYLKNGTVEPGEQRTVTTPKPNRNSDVDRLEILYGKKTRG